MAKGRLARQRWAPLQVCALPGLQKLLWSVATGPGEPHAMADGGGEPDNPHLFNDEGAANAEVAANLQEDEQPLDVTDVKDVKDVKVWRLRGELTQAVPRGRPTPGLMRRAVGEWPFGVREVKTTSTKGDTNDLQQKDRRWWQPSNHCRARRWQQT